MQTARWEQFRNSQAVTFAATRDAVQGISQRRWATSKTTRWAKNDLEHIGRKNNGKDGKVN
jgi:hypothetical protein